MENNFDSKEELYFYWWLEELKKNGYVNQIKHEPLAFLFPGLTTEYTDRSTKKGTVKETVLISDSKYTCDFYIEWNQKARGLFYDLMIDNSKDKPVYNKSIRKILAHDFTGKHISYIEIKPSFDKNNMTRLVKTKIAWTMDIHNVFVNLIKIPDWFKYSFTPKRYLITDNTKKPRKIKYQVTTLDEFKNK